MQVANKRIKNRETTLSLENLQFPLYSEIIEKIRRKSGKRPTLAKDLPQGEWTEQARKVLEERYLYRNLDGKIAENPDEMCWRVAWNIASAEALWGATRKNIIALTKEFYRLLVSRKFLPNSPTLMNAGTDNNLQYSGCYVVPVGDSLEEIFDAIKYQALIHQSGGGTGFAFSRLRPGGSLVRSSHGVASGPISFMKIFDAATNEIKQGGKRRGANMGVLRVDHPDVMEFIHSKDNGEITNFNISVAITEKFMKAYEKDHEYELVSPKNGEAVGKLSARRVFDEICEGAYKTGDPGLIFIDRMNKGSSNPVPTIGPIESTNPCGEQPLYPFDSCNLGSIFLTYFIKKEVNGQKVVDWNQLKKATRLATRFLDNVIEMNPYPLSQVRQTTLAIRRIGLGVGGWADMLVDLGVPYDSPEALDLAREVMKVVYKEAVDASQVLAQERGPFPLWPISIYQNQKPRRNSTVTTIAPTGSISIIAGSSSGIEPLFAIAYQHIVKDKHLDRTLDFINPKFEEIVKEKGFWSEELKEKVIKHGVIRDMEEIPQEVRAMFGTAHEIDPEWHIRTQSLFQEYTENAVSKTINLRNNATIEDVKKAYLLAWEMGCKGITVFRDGCKDAQVLNLGVNNLGVKEQGEEKQPEVWERPIKASGATYKLKTPIGTAFITVNQDEAGNPMEAFINIGRAGSDVQGMAEALGRLISTSLRFGNNMTARERAYIIIDQLRGIGGRRSVGFGPNKILSLSDAIAVALSLHLGIKVNGNGVYEYSNSTGKAGAVVVANTSAVSNETKEGNDPTMATASLPLFGQSGDICPTCGSGTLVFEEGCAKCYGCGYSEC